MIRNSVSGQNVKRPAVPGAFQLASPKLANTQRRPRMGTPIQKGKKLVADAADEDGASMDLNGFKAVFREVLKIKDWDVLSHQR
jgi:hypothetical protein